MIEKEICKIGQRGVRKEKKSLEKDAKEVKKEREVERDKRRLETEVKEVEKER